MSEVDFYKRSLGKAQDMGVTRLFFVAQMGDMFW